MSVAFFLRQSAPAEFLSVNPKGWPRGISPELHLQLFVTLKNGD
jgi:hypothetical protein